MQLFIGIKVASWNCVLELELFLLNHDGEMKGHKNKLTLRERLSQEITN